MVAVIVGAYGFFGISCLIGLTNLVMMSVSGEKNSVMLKERVRELSIVNEMSLWIGLALMTIGTFLGAVWANESWDVMLGGPEGDVGVDYDGDICDRDASPLDTEMQ